MRSYECDLASAELNAMREAASGRQKRAKLGGQVAAKGGAIKVSQCREISSKRQEKEDEKAKRKKARDEKKAQKQQNSTLGQISFLINGGPLEGVTNS